MMSKLDYRINTGFNNYNAIYDYVDFGGRENVVCSPITHKSRSSSAPLKRTE